MANSRYVNTNFWKDNYVADLDPTEKIVFLYLLTNPQATLAGAYEINLREIAFDTGIDKDMVTKIMQRFERDEKIVMDNGWVVLLNYQKHQRLNPNGIVQVERTYAALPKSLQQHLARSSTFLAQVSKLLALHQDEQGKPVYNRETHMPKILLDKAIERLLHIEVEDRSNIDTNVSILAINAKDVEIAPKKIKVASTEINDMFAQWELIVGYKIDSRIKQNRFACSNLLKKHGRDDLIKLITGVAAAQQDRFAPGISDFSQLQQKMSDLLRWGKQQQNKKSKVMKI